MRDLEWSHQPVRNGRTPLSHFPNCVPPTQFGQVLLLDRKREWRGGSRIFVLKIRVANKEGRNTSLPGSIISQLGQTLYLNIRQADYWTWQGEAFYLALVNCNLKEAAHCKSRLEGVFQHTFSENLAKRIAIHIDMVPVDETIERFLGLPPQNPPYLTAPERSPARRPRFKFIWQMFLLKGMLPLFVHAGLSIRALSQYHFAKRLMDIFLCVLLMALCLPAFAGIALAIYLEDPGPVIFKQKRIGFQGRPFYIYKFRTMRLSSTQDQEHEKLVAKILQNEGDRQVLAVEYQNYIRARTTRVGRFLRKTSLDELPQLWNVLRNEMSLVGPRPHPDYEVRRYRQWYRLRLLAKPGLTGLSKINMRFSPENYEESIRLDIRYIRNWSLKEDLRILLKTAGVLFVDYE